MNMKINKIILVFVVLAIFIYTIPVFAVSTASGADLKAELVKYEPSPAEKGKVMTVWIKIENVGAEKAENAIFTLVTNYPFTLVNEDDMVREYGSIRANSDIELEYRLLIDRNAPKGISHLKLKYTFGSSTSEYEKEVDITIQDAPTDADLEVLLVETDKLAYPGATVRLTSDIINVAPGSANYIIAKVETDIATIERNEIFVGTLEADDFDSMDIDMKINPNIEPGEYTVKYILTYKDEDFEEKIVEDEISMEIVSLKQGLESQSTADPVMLIVTIIVLLVIIRAIGMRVIKWFFRPFVKKWQPKKTV